MTAVPPEKKPSDATVRALASIDLTGGEEAPVQTFGRIAGGIVLMILGLVIGLGFLAVYLLGWLWEPVADWAELFGDLLLIPATLGLGLLITGFELVRRGRKKRAAEAAEAADLITKLGAAGALDGTATAASIDDALSGPRTGDMDASTQKPIPGSGETHV